MAYTNQLTPEQIQQILAAGQYGTTNIGGMDYGLSGQESNNEGGVSFNPNAILGYQPGNMGKGASRAEYGLNGGFAQMGHNETPSMKDGIVPLLFALGAGAFAPGGFMAGAGGGGGAVSGMDLAADGGANSLTGFYGSGSGAAAGLGDGGASSALGGDTTSAAMGPNTYAQSVAADGTLQSSLAPYAVDGASSGSGWLSSILGDGAGSVMKYAAPIIGGLLGSKGVNKTQTQQTNLPDYLKGPVTGQGGLLQGAQNLFQQQTAPGALPGYGQMQSVGQGLLNQPIAGNGVAQFNAMPRFGAPRR